jgi:hypothetical protein
MELFTAYSLLLQIDQERTHTRFSILRTTNENSYLSLRVEESLSSPASRTSSTGDEMHGGAAGTRAASPDGLLKKKSLRPELRTTTAMAKSKSRLSSRRAALNSAISAKPRALEGKLTHLTNYPCQTKNYAARACSRLDGIIYGLLTIATKRSRENAYALLRPTNYMFLNLIVCYYSH